MQEDYTTLNVNAYEENADLYSDVRDVEERACIGEDEYVNSNTLSCIEDEYVNSNTLNHIASNWVVQRFLNAVYFEDSEHGWTALSDVNSYNLRTNNNAFIL